MSHHDDDPGRRIPPPGPEPTRRRARVDRAAMASNWQQVLAVDALFGLVMLVAGIAVAVLVSPPVGVLLACLGAAYLGAGARRWRRWVRLRAEAGLDQPDDGPGGGGPATE